MHTLISLLHHDAVDVWVTCSVLGYCILPIVLLAAVAIIVKLQNIFGLMLAGLVIAWCTYGATRFVGVCRYIHCFDVGCPQAFPC
jgi:hypothetical protein